MTGTMKEAYESPMMEILTVEVDILTSSGEDENLGGQDPYIDMGETDF
jgi:hypothetical protein